MNESKTWRCQTCNRLYLDTLGSWLTLYAQKLPGHCYGLYPKLTGIDLRTLQFARCGSFVQQLLNCCGWVSSILGQLQGCMDVMFFFFPFLLLFLFPSPLPPLRIQPCPVPPSPNPSSCVDLTIIPTTMISIVCESWEPTKDGHMSG